MPPNWRPGPKLIGWPTDWFRASGFPSVAHGQLIGHFSLAQIHGHPAPLTASAALHNFQVQSAVNKSHLLHLLRRTCCCCGCCCCCCCCCCYSFMTALYCVNKKQMSNADLATAIDLDWAALLCWTSIRLCIWVYANGAGRPSLISLLMRALNWFLVTHNSKNGTVAYVMV